MEYEVARAAMAAAEHATRMQAEQEARMVVERVAWMASGKQAATDSSLSGIDFILACTDC